MPRSCNRSASSASATWLLLPRHHSTPKRCYGLPIERGPPPRKERIHRTKWFDGYRAPSILQVPGARDVAIEFHSMSKTFAMSGWRIGWAVGNRDVIEALGSLKSYLDTGPLLAVQRAAVPVLDQAAASRRTVMDAYGERHRAAAAALDGHRIPYWESSASPFLWVTIPPDQESGSWANRLLEEAGVAVWAGTAFGPGGDGFVRLALAESPTAIIEAVERMDRYYR